MACAIHTQEATADVFIGMDAPEEETSGCPAPLDGVDVRVCGIEVRSGLGEKRRERGVLVVEGDGTAGIESSEHRL